MIPEFLADDQIEIKIRHAPETPIIVGGSLKIVDEAFDSLPIHLAIAVAVLKRRDLIRYRTSPPVSEVLQSLFKKCSVRGSVISSDLVTADYQSS
ncbi:MAG: hypothetical protein JWP25_7253 [Bradyrhizobium sp.]|nr:hypothetical protein [Bradyrhizobium sp.]